MSENDSDPEGDFPAEDLEDLYENAPCGYLSLRPDGRIARVNATFTQWTGFSAQDLIGGRLRDLLNMAGRIFHETHFAPLLRMQGFFHEVALDFRKKDGGHLPMLVNAAERRDAEGRSLGVRLTLFNATDRHRYEKELLDARAAADATNRRLEEVNAAMRDLLNRERETAALREQFIAVLGHDLRNPLGAIVSGLSLLARTPLNDRAVSVMGMMGDSATRMTGMIDNIMDFARGRLGGGLSLTRVIVDMDPVLHAVLAELESGASGRLEARFALDQPLFCDPARISQLFSNLVGNALTHGSKSEPIRINAGIEDGCFTLSVANAGEPIPPAALENLFQPFFRASVRPNREGLGLGLYIAHEIATAHGGTLRVISTSAETRFTFSLPLKQDGTCL